MRLVNIEDKIKNLISDLESFGFEMNSRLFDDGMRHMLRYKNRTGPKFVSERNKLVVSAREREGKCYLISIYNGYESMKTGVHVDADLDFIIEQLGEDARELLYNLDLIT